MQPARRTKFALSILGVIALVILAAHLFRTVPPATGRLDDLTISAEPALKQLPGVAQVEVAVQARNPTNRIIHLRDWHYVPKNLYAIDLRDAAGKPLSEAEVDRLHGQLCQQVEAVQQEQMALLLSLVKHHGLKRIYCEGLTEKELASYREKLVALRSIQKEAIPQLQKQLEEVRELKTSLKRAGREKSKGYETAVDVEREVAALLQQHRENLLEVGAAGRLFITEEIEEVLPLDDDDLLEQAKPITPDGKVKLDQEKLAAREDAIVRAATAREPLAVIVLGGSHDLSASVRRVCVGRCEYVRVTTREVLRFADGKEY